MSSLAVEKIKKQVTVSMSDERKLSGHIFLSPFSVLGVGQQTIFDALTAEGRFIPFETNEGEFSFLNQYHIVWLASMIDEDEESVLFERRNATVYLQDGKRLRGDLIMALPEEKSRMSDWLNQVEGFMVLRDQKREVLINVNYVVRVT